MRLVARLEDEVARAGLNDFLAELCAHPAFEARASANAGGLTDDEAVGQRRAPSPCRWRVSLLRKRPDSCEEDHQHRAVELVGDRVALE